MVSLKHADPVVCGCGSHLEHGVHVPALLRAVSLDELADLSGEVRLELQVAHLQILQQLLSQGLRVPARTSQNAELTRKGRGFIFDISSPIIVIQQWDLMTSVRVLALTK